jgi:hypothetical protein
VADFDKCGRKEWSTGYVPTIVLIDNGEVVEKFAGNDYAKIEKFTSS